VKRAQRSPLKEAIEAGKNFTRYYNFPTGGKNFVSRN